MPSMDGGARRDDISSAENKDYRIFSGKGRDEEQKADMRRAILGRCLVDIDLFAKLWEDFERT